MSRLGHCTIGYGRGELPSRQYLAVRSATLNSLSAPLLVEIEKSAHPKLVDGHSLAYVDRFYKPRKTPLTSVAFTNVLTVATLLSHSSLIGSACTSFRPFCP